MSTKEKVLSRCKAVADSGDKCPESGAYVYEHESNDGMYYELCFDGAHLCIMADGTGGGFEAAARWLGLHNPWRLTRPPIGAPVLAYSPMEGCTISIYQGNQKWRQIGSNLEHIGITHWQPLKAPE